MEEPTAETVEEVFEEVAKLTPWGFLAWLGFLLPGKQLFKLFWFVIDRIPAKTGFQIDFDYSMTLTRWYNFEGLPQNHFIFQKRQVWDSKLCLGVATFTSVQLTLDILITHSAIIDLSNKLGYICSSVSELK